MLLRPGQEAVPPDLPGYRYIKPIGTGGNAQVFLYEQHLPRRKVAVKVLNEAALSEQARRRFTAEANVTAGLPHRHIVQVFDAKVTDDGRPYIVMPYYPQPNLSVRARRSHFSVADVLRIGIQIGSAVETSHRAGVLHRDIKPQNILTDSYGEPALTDFGIATTKAGDGPEGLSVPWSPPEILYGTSPGDQRSDVYSLGATLWHLLAGRSPFEVPGDNGTLALMARIKSDAPPRTQRADVPDSLERLLRQAMSKDPAARPQSAMELIRGLQSVEQELRLPLTQPTLAADELPGDTQGGDTISLPRRRAGDDMFSRRPDRPGLGEPRSPGGPRENTQGPGAGYAAPRAHSGLPPQRDPGQPVRPARGSTGQSARGAVPREETAARDGGAASPWPPAAGPGPWTPAPGPRPADDNDNVTLKRGPVRIDPRGSPAAGAQAQPAYGQGPAGPGAWGNAPAAGPPRARQFPREVLETATVARPRGGAPGGTGSSGAPGAGSFGRAGTGPGAAAGPSGAANPGKQGNGRARVLALVVGGAALAILAGVAVVVLPHGGGQPGSAPASGGQQTLPGGSANALGDGAPGTPVITPTRLGATKVRFTWTYDDSAPTDSFEWRLSGTVPGSSGEAAKPELVVTVPSGEVACLEVRVMSAQGAASGESDPVCWP